MSSASRLMAIVAACLGVSAVFFGFTNVKLLAWLLMAASFPLIMEAAAWQQAELFAGMRHDLDPDSLRGAYKVTDALPRLAFLYIWLFSVLAARELRALPDNGWIAVIILAPFAVWVALAYRSHSQTISVCLAKRRA